MQSRFFIIACLSCILCGCGKPPVPSSNHLAAQLLQETFKALAEDSNGRSLKLLRRLGDMYPGDPFFTMAQAHERERLAISEVNTLLAAGRLPDADAFLQQTLKSDHPGPTLLRARELSVQLSALRRYLALLPFPDSEQTVAAMNLLRQQQTQTGLSPSFAAWWDDQEAARVRQQVRERAVAAGQLLQAVDLAAVQEDPAIWTLLAHIRCLNPGYPGLSSIETCLAGNWADVTPRFGADSATGGNLAGLEVGTLLCWPRLPTETRHAIQSHFQQHGASSLSGLLLQALLAATEGQVDASLAAMRELAASTPLGRTTCRALLETLGLPATQFSAGCWRPSAPSVPDLLSRVQQFRAQYARGPEGPRP
ncbi:MAG: hypothetical protein A3K19_17975 [Lentisphaerae bacterium RIFOXYB12_FULL_65_16]|nr:MAG: hypothetical protein A3K18_11025 [Lentisphaerae bacterium RIFOXYA12_64_32]OGV87126.1 MAG: hypothetical protein A3K19_17975 [Lentisphaerae bacterium RIFOXYB12_FULL_65_16]